MYWLCGQVSGNIPVLKLWQYFFYEQIFSVFQTLNLVGIKKVLAATAIRFVFGKVKLYLMDKVKRR